MSKGRSSKGRVRTQQFTRRGRTTSGRPSDREISAVRSRRSVRSEASGRGGERRREELPPRLKVRGWGLRPKFVAAMSTVAGAALLGLGLLLAITTNNFLFDQTRHQGVELAKMTAQVGRALIDQIEAGSIDREEAARRLQRLLDNARRWGHEGIGAYSVIHGIIFERGPLHGIGVGSLPDAGSSVLVGDTDFDIPGHRTVRLEHLEDVDAYPTYSTVQGVRTPVYRFKVRLNEAEGPGYTPQAVWVDVGIGNIDRVRNRLYLLIAIGGLVFIALVVAVASHLANRITSPMRSLMNDMRLVAKGDLGHRTKARSNDEIGVLASEFNLMTTTLRDAQEAVVEQEKAAYELTIAREVQRQLLPSSEPELAGYEIAAFYQGAKAVSGDYYDFIPLGDGLMGFIVADVSGKGVPGSLVMGVTRTTVRLIAPHQGRRAATVLRATNRHIAGQIKRGMFVTAFYVVLDPANGQMVFTAAGHNPMAIYRHATKGVELQAPRGLALGFDPGPRFDQVVQEFTTALGPGDAFVLYTDGFPEAMDDQNAELGEEAFYQAIAGNGYRGARGLVDALVDQVAEHRGRAAQSDDLTMIVVRRKV